MAVSRSRSLKNLQQLRLEMKLGPSDTPQREAVIGVSPDTPMAQINVPHYTKFELLAGGRSANAAPAGATITAPQSTGQSTPPTGALDPSEMGLTREQGLRASTDAQIKSISEDPTNTFAKPPNSTAASVASKASQVIGNVTKYNPQTFVRDELLKKPLAAAAKSALGAKAGFLANPVIKYLLGI